MVDGDPKNAKVVEATEALDTARRAFLKNAGKVVVYTPPAMLALSAPSFRAIAQSSGSGDQSPPATGDGGGDGGGGGGLDWFWEWLRRLLGG